LDSSNRINLPDDLIRTLAIFLVILLHASNATLQLSSVSTSYWWTAAVYKSLAISCVPLFVMLSGALLLQPAKIDEPIRVFLKKRLSRLGLAFVFWSAIYTVWGFYIYHVPVTLSNIYQSIVKDLFTGAWYQFWFIYLIVGLYLITPILRVLIAYANPKIIRYLILIWFLGVAIVPLAQLASGYDLNPLVFVISGWVGYFVLGVYLQTIKLRNSILYSLLALSFIGTLVGVWLVQYPLSGLNQNFFDYLSINVIIGSAALFLILMKFRADWPGSKHKTFGRVIRAISTNTLPIFLFHVIILESFERGFFGLTLSVTTLNPIIEIPLIAVLTLFITLGLVLLMRKVPILNKLIG
jgi:surface polysaccharide O-acyltransferase-like enzyme